MLRQERSDGGADIAADLKKGLRQAMPAARGQPRHSGGFGVEDGRAGADQGGGQQQQIEMVRHRQQQEAAEGGAHADGEGVAVTGDADIQEFAVGGDGPGCDRTHSSVDGIEAV